MAAIKVGCSPTGSIQFESWSGQLLLHCWLFAMWAFSDRRIGYLLQIVLFESTVATLVTVYWHLVDLIILNVDMNNDFVCIT